MSVPQELPELVERFNTNREAYRSGQYNETQLRREFIDPFFQLLGWDVNNKNGYAEAYKDVIHEDSIKNWRPHKSPRLLLPYWWRPQILRRNKETIGQY